jgi:hypothetical protein
MGNFSVFYEDIDALHRTDCGIKDSSKKSLYVVVLELILSGGRLAWCRALRFQ